MTTIYTDGFMFSGNPSPIGGGYTITDADGNLIERETIHQPGITNNEVELRGVVAAVELAEEGSTVITDSMIALKWVSGGRCKARPDLSSVARKCKTLVKQKKIKIEFACRKENLAGVYNEKNRVGEEHHLNGKEASDADSGID